MRSQTQSLPCVTGSRALGGVSLKISEDFDYDADRQADVCAILVGKTKAPESRRQMQALGYHDWAVTRQGRQIYVVSNTEQALVEALACFGSELIDAYQTESGAPPSVISVTGI